MVTVYDPFAAFFGLAVFVMFFGVLFSAVLFPMLPFVLMDSMGDWWRSRGERELQRAQAERERAAAAEASLAAERAGLLNFSEGPFRASAARNRCCCASARRP